MTISMYDRAKNNLSSVDVEKVKSIIKRIEPDYYKKMLIEEDAEIKRTDYWYIKYEGKEIERNEKKIEFPHYGKVIEIFSKFEGGTEKFQTSKVAISPEQSVIFELLKETYKIVPTNEDLSKLVANWQNFSLKLNDEGLLKDEQEKYFFPDLTVKTTGTAEFVKGPIEGDFGRLIFVETYIDVHDKLKEEGRLSPRGAERLEKPLEEEIKHQCFVNAEMELVFKNYSNFDNDNTDTIEKYDEYSSEICQDLRAEFGVAKMAQEKIYYQVIPCLQLSYLHILANTEHELTIINPLEPEKTKLIFHSAPENTKSHLKDTAKWVSGAFSKMVGSKGHSKKEDRRKEINLLIRLVRVDGEIHEAEKRKLSENIGSLAEFTQGEKQNFFDLMVIEPLPTLTKDDVNFSSETIEKEVINNLEEIAKVDNEYAEKEQRFIEKVKKLMAKD